VIPCYTLAISERFMAYNKALYKLFTLLYFLQVMLISNKRFYLMHKWTGRQLDAAKSNTCFT